MGRLDGCDAVLFLDDDFPMAQRCVGATLAALQADPAIVATTGDLVADGIKGPGRDPAAAPAVVEADLRTPARDDLPPASRGYECSMAADLLHSAWSETWVDRRDRLRGDMRAVAGMVRGRLSPERSLEL